MAHTPWRAALTSLALAAAVAAHGQNLPQPLLEAAQQALASNPALQARYKAFRETRALQDAAAAGWLPRVDASASASRIDRKYTNNATAAFNTNGVQLSLQQLLFDGGVVAAAMRGADATRLARYYDLLESAEVVSLDTLEAYLNLARRRELVQLATENFVEHKLVANLLQERVAAAVGRGVDFRQAEGRLALAESALVDEQQALASTEAAYQNVTGVLPPPRLPRWPESLHVTRLPESVAEVVQQGLQTSPLLLAGMAQVQVQAQGVEGRQSAYWPNVRLQARVSQANNQDNVAGQSRDWVAQAEFAQNVYRGGSDQAQTAQAEALQRRAQAQLDSTCRQVRETLVLRHKDVGKLQVQLDLADQRLQTMERTLVAFRQQFDIGQRTLLDLLDTQSEYFEAHRSFINTRFDQLVAEARALAAQGKLAALLGGAEGVPAVRELDLPGIVLDPATLCPQELVLMDSLEAVKASLKLPERVLPKKSYVVLLPNDDGSVGKIVVNGSIGQRVIDQAGFGASVKGDEAAQAVPAKTLAQDFAEAQQARPQLAEAVTLLFTTGSTRLTPEGEAAFADLVERIKARQAVDITIAGHTDTVNSTRFNEALSLRRAQTVEARLRALNLALVDITLEAYGESQLAVPTPDNRNEARNRRVVVTIR